MQRTQKGRKFIHEFTKHLNCKQGCSLNSLKLSYSQYVICDISLSSMSLHLNWAKNTGQVAKRLVTHVFGPEA